MSDEKDRKEPAPESDGGRGSARRSPLAIALTLLLSLVFIVIGLRLIGVISFGSGVDSESDDEEGIDSTAMVVTGTIQDDARCPDEGSAPEFLLQMKTPSGGLLGQGPGVVTPTPTLECEVTFEFEVASADAYVLSVEISAGSQAETFEGPSYTSATLEQQSYFLRLTPSDFPGLEP